MLIISLFNFKLYPAGDFFFHLFSWYTTTSIGSSNTESGKHNCSQYINIGVLEIWVIANGVRAMMNLHYCK